MRGAVYRTTLSAGRGSKVIGSVLDKFEVLQKIGEGGMATVYRGRHTALGRDVAIKVLHPHLSRSERNRQRFAREARAIEHLSHDNILEIFDYSGTEVDDCYIVTEFVDGLNLQQVLVEQGRLPSEVVLQIGIKLSDALAYAHQLGIIHRDLKPENVMLRRDGAVKLMDFGIARFLDEVHLTVTGALVGSPAYMSPEQAMERVLDCRSDLFSLGTLLFHLATGELPFSGSNPSIILRNIIEGTRSEVHALCPAACGSMAEIIDQLLQTNPDDRPDSAAEVQLKLRAALDDLNIEPGQAGWDVRDWLEDPAAYESRQQAYLRETLLGKGKLLLADGEHLKALGLLNRLLAIDEENDEVMSLIRGMHDLRDEARPSVSPVWKGLLAIGIAAGLTFFLWPNAPEPIKAESDDGEQVAQLEDNRAPEDLATDSPQPEDPLSEEESSAGDPVDESTEINAADAEGPPVGGSTEDGPPRSGLPSNEPSVDGASTRRGTATETGDKDPESSPSETEASTDSEQTEAEPGYLTVTVGSGEWGSIYVDDRARGSIGRDTRIPVEPGHHRIRVDNNMKSGEADILVESGKPYVIEIPRLVSKPATATISSSFHPDCVVELDGVILGTIAVLGSRFSIEDPDSDHKLVLDCGGNRQELLLNDLKPLGDVTITPP